MRKNKIINRLTIFSFLLFLVPEVIFAFDQDSISSRAFRFFDNNNYQEAAPLFKKLLQSKPNVEMLNYYYGVCETENRNFSKIILSHLQKANNEESPKNLGYYLGMQYHAAGDWQNALKQYNRFKLLNNNDDLKDVNEKIQQCFQKINPFEDEYIFTEEELVKQLYVSDTLATDEIVVSGDTILPETDSAYVNNIAVPAQEEITTEPEPIKEEITQITEPVKITDLVIGSNISYHYTDDFQTEMGKNFFLKSDSSQMKLESVLQKINSLREKYKTEEVEQKKQIIAQDILALENETFHLEKEKTDLLYQAAMAENEYWQSKTEEEIATFNENQKKKMQIVNQIKTSQNARDTAKEEIIIPDFLVLNEDEKPNFSDNPGEEELIYKIQIGAFSRGLPRYIERLYKKLSYIRKIENYTDENGVVVYTTGNLTNLEDAIRMQNQVRQEGVEDAFVVPYFNGKRITLQQAKKITDEK